MDYLTHHLLRSATQAFPDKEALVIGNRRLGFSEIDTSTDRLAHGLVALGLQRSDRVGVLLEKSVEETLAILATSKAGGVFVPVNHLLFPHQIEHIVRDCTPRVLVTTRGRLEGLESLLEEATFLETVIVVDGEADDSFGGKRVVPLSSLLSDGSSPGAPPADRCVSQDLAALLYTSGSTGRPKGVMVTHANLMAGSRIVSTYLEITDRERILSILPFSFDYGLNQLLTGIEKRATVVLLSFRFPGEVVNEILRENVTGLAGVPPFWVVFTQSGSPVYRQPLPTLRYITNSGGAVPKPLLDSLRKALPTTDVVLMYGLTEAFRSTYLPPSEIDRRPGSMGKAIPDTEIFVLEEEGKRCAPGEPGELVHRGPTVSLGYWGQPEATAKVIRPNPLALPQVTDPELVCYSGDIVRMDEDGYLYFIGRQDATIKCSGYRISPTEVEEVVVETGRVSEAAAIAIPDEIMGQAVMIYVVAKDGAEIDVDVLLGDCAIKMPRYMIPRRVDVVDGLPRTAHGKIDYPALRRRAADSENSRNG